MTQWTPIDDRDNPAPRDGTLILIGNYNHQREWCADVWAGQAIYEAIENHRTGKYSRAPHLEWVPTHWMPLPPPPEQE